MRQREQEGAHGGVVYKKRRQLPEAWRRFRKNRRAVFGGILVLLPVLLLFLFSEENLTISVANLKI